MGRECAMLTQNASLVWPDSVRPLMSTSVPLTMTGMRKPLSSKKESMANSAALAFSVSKMVSTSSRSTPPAIRPSTCS